MMSSSTTNNSSNTKNEFDENFAALFSARQGKILLHRKKQAAFANQSSAIESIIQKTISTESSHTPPLLMQDNSGLIVFFSYDTGEAIRQLNQLHQCMKALAKDYQNLILSKTILAILHGIYRNVSRHLYPPVSEENTKKTPEEQVQLTMSWMQIEMWVHNHCWKIEGHSLIACHRGENITDLCLHLAAASVNQCNEMKNEYSLSQMQKYLSYFHQIVEDGLNHESTVDLYLKNNHVIDNMSCFKTQQDFIQAHLTHEHILQTRASLLQNRIDQAVAHAIKAAHLFQGAMEKGEFAFLPHQPFFDLCNTLISELSKSNQDEHILFFAKSAKNALKQLQITLLNHRLGLLDIPLDTGCAPHPSLIQQYDTQLQHLKTIIEQIKPLVLKTKMRQIQSIFSQHSFINEQFTVSHLESNSFILSIQFKNHPEQNRILYKKLKQAGYEVWCDPNNAIHLYNVLDMDIEKTFLAAFTQWHEEVTRMKEIKSQSQRMDSTPLIEPSKKEITPHVPPAPIPDPPKKNKDSNPNSINKINEKLKGKKKRSATPQSKPKPVPSKSNEKVISWGKQYPDCLRPAKNTIIFPKNKKKMTDAERNAYFDSLLHEALHTSYPVYDHTMVGQYLYIKKEFAEYLRLHDPDLLEKLIFICRREKGMNDSQGNKGTMIKGHDVKLKDASKPYRFYGKHVEIVQTEAETEKDKAKGKKINHNLFQINSYTENKKEKSPKHVF